MAIKLMGKKRGMIQLFDESGNIVVCTVIHADPNVITQIKTKESDGYNAVQLGFEKVVAKDPRRQEERTTKPLRGHFERAGVEPRRHLKESRIENTSEFKLGDEIGVGFFASIAYIDATAISKGKGHQGVMKRHHFRGMRATHGAGPTHRHAGSTGQRSTPGRTLPGVKKSGHMGDEQVTVQNLKVIMVNEADNVLVVKGQVPGPRNGLVYISKAQKKS